MNFKYNFGQYVYVVSRQYPHPIIQEGVISGRGVYEREGWSNEVQYDISINEGKFLKFVDEKDVFDANTEKGKVIDRINKLNLKYGD